VSLAGLQSALVATVIARSSRPEGDSDDLAARADLDGNERHWLRSVERTAGFQLTCAVQRWWREYRLRSAARLTVAVLERCARIALLEEWIASRPIVSFFYQAEVREFVDFVLARTSDLAPGARALLELERAAHVAMSARGFASGSRRPRAADSIVRHPAAALVVFPGQPGAVIAEWLEGKEPPRSDQACVGVLVAAGIRGLGRQAGREEIDLWEACSRPRRVGDLRYGPSGGTLLRRFLAMSVLRLDSARSPGRA
jgi:hypothetical protein